MTGAMPTAWSGVFAMSLCVFALIASEFMPVSLLTPIASQLRITEGMAGQGVAMSGAFAVLASLSIAALSRNVNRKTLLLGLTAVMCLSGAVVGLAQDYKTYLIGRALIGLVVGGFWSMSAATAMRLVPLAEVPRALAIFNGGNALATIVAAPLGSYLGAMVGWRGAFLALVPVGVLVLIWQWISLPDMPTRSLQAQRSANVFRLLHHRVVRLGMLATALFFAGQFMLFTYLRPFLESVTHVEVATLSLVLLGVGVSGFVGTSVIGRLLRFGLYRALAIIPLVMATIAAALVAFGDRLGAVFPLLALWGLVATAAPVGWWSWVARTMPDDAEAGGGLSVAVIQLAIAGGSTLGGVLYDTSGHGAAFLVSAALLVAASGTAVLCARVPQHISGRADV
ncbi:MFS transporter [Roseateles terrae]|nr:MFS transporter [Roseateles terrae]